MKKQTYFRFLPFLLITVLFTGCASFMSFLTQTFEGRYNSQNDYTVEHIAPEPVNLVAQFLSDDKTVSIRAYNKSTDTYTTLARGFYEGDFSNTKSTDFTLRINEVYNVEPDKKGLRKLSVANGSSEVLLPGKVISKKVFECDLTELMSVIGFDAAINLVRFERSLDKI